MLVGGGGERWGERGGETNLLTCSYPLKVQACPPRDQKPALRSRVSGIFEEVGGGRGGGGGTTINMRISTEGSSMPTKRTKNRLSGDV